MKFLRFFLGTLYDVLWEERKRREFQRRMIAEDQWTDGTDHGR